MPFIWGFYLVDGRDEEYHEFADRNALISFLQTERIQKMRPLIYAHNGGRFDYHYLLPDMNSNEQIMVVSGRIAKFRVGTVEFRDSYNILPVPLKAFAKEEIDYAKLEPDVRHLHMDEIRRYLRSDCIYLYDFVRQYQETYGRGLTSAGGSMRYWQKFSGTKAPKQTPADFVRLKPYYYGGRVQCFEQGSAACDFKVMDINSAYPYAMLHPHPYSTAGIISDTLPPEGKIAPCLISLDAIAQGCFPLRDEREALYFPDDEKTVRTYHITGHELLAALELNAVKIIRIRDVYRFAELIDFKDYILHFYQQRQEAKRTGDKARDVFAKLLMNSLYGKFGADPSTYDEWIIASSGTFVSWAKEQFEYLRDFPDADGGMKRYLMSRPLPEKKHRYYNVATAASITGFVRAHLFKALRACSGLIYCDTDSIAAREVGQLPAGDALGQWKQEMTCDSYAVAGKKLYAFRERDTGKFKIASKGAKLNAEQIQRVANGETVIYNPLVPTYSLTTKAPTFVTRDLRRTARDISLADERIGSVH